jgi:hypothetical protein
MLFINNDTICKICYIFILIYITTEFHLAVIYCNNISLNKVKAISIMYHCDRTNFEMVTIA